VTSVAPCGFLRSDQLVLDSLIERHGLLLTGADSSRVEVHFGIGSDESVELLVGDGRRATLERVATIMQRDVDSLVEGISGVPVALSPAATES
jgi:hypothetical protein